jgi:DNA-binding CsgD family transcriptional regulator
MNLLVDFAEHSDLNNIVDQDLLHLKHLNFFLFCKDLDGKYINCNDRLLKGIGFCNKQDMLGRTDFDISCFTENEVTTFRNTDKLTIKENKLISFVEPITLSDNRTVFALTNKYPLRSKTNKIIGNIGLSLLANIEPINVLPKYTQVDISEKSVLSRRQVDCLYYLLKGLTCKQIAKQLNLSPRTVEHHVEAAKDKLGCDNRAELFAKGLNLQVIRDRLLMMGV